MKHYFITTCDTSDYDSLAEIVSFYRPYITSKEYKMHNKFFRIDVIDEAKFRIRDFERRPDDFSVEQLWQITDPYTGNYTEINHYIFVEYHFSYIMFTETAQLRDNYGTFKRLNERHFTIDI